MASEMVERVARAICESELMNPDDALGGWIHWQHAARAAIEAMWEPTEAMERAAEAMDAHEIGQDARIWMYQAMIVAALKEGE